ncbi:hypothetical protein P3T18_004816 [Paraburkholderia sp. GAS199]|uniref:DUF4148 domain-containing protein n=1 Tax=Paraburkholderia sp. GAS199 TaxID=3035126 RepID=UPI003D25CCD5
MKTSMMKWSALSISVALTLAACAVADSPPGAAHLSPTQCQDLAALRNNAPPTPQRNGSELAALRKAGYDPSRWFDPHYPEDLQAAQRQVDLWFQSDCH